MKKKLDNRMLISRIKESRKFLKLSQEDLAVKAGLSSNQTISQIENGSREIKANELFQIANALHLDMSCLIAADAKLSRPHVFWRNPPLNSAVAEYGFLDRCRKYKKLEQLCEIEEESLLPTFSLDICNTSYQIYQKVAELAEKVSQMMNLGCRPSTSLIKILEDKFSIRIFYEDLLEGSAASTVCDEGRAILMNRNEPPWRRNFNFAHEVFHIVTWPITEKLLDSEDAALKDRIESLANVFASHLLMPENYLKDELVKQIGDKTKVSYYNLIMLARTFDVSSEALLWQLCNLRIINKEKVKSLLNNEKFRELDRESLKGLWTSPPTLPLGYVELAYKAYIEGKVSKMKLAEYLECGLMDINSVLGEYGIVESEDNETEVTFIGRERSH